MMTKKEINRAKIQNYALELSRLNTHVVLSWATGVGKSLAAIKIIDEDVQKGIERGEWLQWYIVCAERQHIANWEDEFRKHGYYRLIELGFVQIFCYQSLHKYTHKKVNLVLDEAHMVTDLRLDILKRIKGDKIISLSASLEPERAEKLNELEPYKEYVITTDQAIKAEILAKPIIIKVELNLYHKLRDRYIDLTVNIDNIVEKYREAELKLLSTEDKYRGILLKELKDLDFQIIKARMQRKALLSNSKTNLARKLQEQIESWNKKYIIFTGSVAQCRKLGQGKLDISSYHPSKQNNQRIEDFNNSIIRGLVTNRMVRQGTNLEGIEMGVITQLDSKELSFVQMMGRIFRSNKPVLFVFVTKDTVDEVYWETCSKDIDPAYITSFNEYISNHHEKD